MNREAYGIVYSLFKYRENEGTKDIGSQYWNPGRTEEIRDRFVHLGGDEPEEKVRYDNDADS